MRIKTVADSETEAQIALETSLMAAFSARDRFAKRRDWTMSSWWSSTQTKRTRRAEPQCQTRSVASPSFWICGWSSWRRLRAPCRMKSCSNACSTSNPSCSTRRKSWNAPTMRCTERRAKRSPPTQRPPTSPRPTRRSTVHLDTLHMRAPCIQCLPFITPLDISYRPRLTKSVLTPLNPDNTQSYQGMKSIFDDYRKCYLKNVNSFDMKNDANIISHKLNIPIVKSTLNLKQKAKLFVGATGLRCVFCSVHGLFCV